MSSTKTTPDHRTPAEKAVTDDDRRRVMELLKQGINTPHTICISQPGGWSKHFLGYDE